MKPSYNDLCILHGSDKSNALPNGNDYANFYEHWFAPRRTSINAICEIGIANGSSIRASLDYFENAKFIALDIFDKQEHNGQRVQTRILDQGNIEELHQFANECLTKNLTFDIIIDDGSHNVAHQQQTFGILFPLVNPGGIYIIEDLGSSYLCLNSAVYGYAQTQEMINNNTIQFLQQRPFSSPWIATEARKYINDHITCVSIFDKLNRNCTYLDHFKCTNDYPMRAITSVIEKM